MLSSVSASNSRSSASNSTPSAVCAAASLGDVAFNLDVAQRVARLALSLFPSASLARLERGFRSGGNLVQRRRALALGALTGVLANGTCDVRATSAAGCGLDAAAVVLRHGGRRSGRFLTHGSQ